MADYAADATDILEALREDGAPLTLTQTTGGTFNPATGAYTGQTTTTKSVYGLLQAPSMPQSGNTGERWFNGTLIQTNDKMMLLAALDSSGAAVVPVVGDTVTLNSVVFTIAALIPVEPGGVALAYRVLVRK